MHLHQRALLAALAYVALLGLTLCHLVPGLLSATLLLGVLARLSSGLYAMRSGRHTCSVGTILFTAIGISLSAISIHGAFRQPDDLFSDEAEQQIGFLSFLKGPQPGTGQNMV